MKHYYAPYTQYKKNNNIQIFAPVNGVISSIIKKDHVASTGLTNKQIRIQADSYPAFTFVILHTDLLSDTIAVGKHVTAGELLGYARMNYPDLSPPEDYSHDFDIAV